MNIAFSSDNNYAPYLAISILSVLKNNSESEICFYILDFGIDNNNKKIIANIVCNHGKSIKFISVDKDEFANFPITINYISLATYARLNITQYIPNVDKLLYIDVDTLTNGSLDDYGILISNSIHLPHVRISLLKLSKPITRPKLA